MSAEQSYSGSLEDLDFPDLIHAIIISRGAGRLSLVSDDVEKSVFFSRGDLLFATSNDPDDRLGDFLLRHGVLRRAQLRELGPELAKGRLLASLLLESSQLDPSLLREYAARHVLELILDLFQWTRGLWTWRPSPLEPRQAALLQASTPDVVFKGIRGIRRWSRVTRGAGDAQTVYRVSGELDRLSLPMELTSNEWSVLGAFREPRSLESVCQSSRLSEFRVFQVVWSFRTLGILRTPPEAERPPLRELLQSLKAAPGEAEPSVDPVHPELAGVPPPETEPARSGPLTGLTLPDLLRSLYVDRASGVLRAESGPVRNELLLSHGTIVGARSSAPEHRLGETAVRLGLIDHQALDAMLGEPTDSVFGQALVRRGVLAPDQLDHVVETQIREILRPMFSWREGRHTFEEVEPQLGELPACELSTAEVILDGVRCMSEFEGIADFLEGLKLKLAPHPNPQLRYQKARLRPTDVFLLSRIGEGATLTELQQLSPVSADETARIVYGLLAAGLIELGEPLEEPAAGEAIGPDPEPGSPVTAEEIEEAANRLAGLDYYGVLGVTPDADPETVSRAYQSRARRFHPDGGRTARERETLDILFSSVVEAGQTLTDPERRRAYDERLAGEHAAAAAPAAEAPVEAPSTAVEDSAAAAEAFRLGMQAYEGKSLLDAIFHLRRATTLDPSNADYQIRLAVALSRNPRWNRDAEEALLKASELEPWRTDVFVLLGRLYRRAGHKRRAERMFRKALELDADDRAAWKALQELTPATGTSRGTLGDLIRKALK